MQKYLNFVTCKTPVISRYRTEYFDIWNAFYIINHRSFRRSEDTASFDPLCIHIIACRRRRPTKGPFRGTWYCGTQSTYSLLRFTTHLEWQHFR